MQGNARLPAVLLLLLAGYAGSVFASDLPGIDRAFDACINVLLERKEPVYQADTVSLKKVCPDLAARLDEPALAHISPPLTDSTSFSQLHDVLRALKSNTPSMNAGNWQLDHAGLNKLLDEVYVPETKPEEVKSFIDVFWDWVREKLREYFEGDNWFTRTFDIKPEPGDEFFEGLKNTTIVILVVFILYIIINELYAANISKFFKRRRMQKSTAADRFSTSNNALHNLNDILQLPLRQQVPALLRYSLQVLISKGIIPRRYSLTNREFLELTRQHAPEISRDLEIIINSSDRVLYGNKSIAAGDASLLFDRVRKLESTQAMEET